MPKVSVYVPKDLHMRLQAAGITPGPICVAALENALDEERLLVSELLRQEATRMLNLAAIVERRFVEAWRRIDAVTEARELFVGTRYGDDLAQMLASTAGDNPGDEASA